MISHVGGKDWSELGNRCSERICLTHTSHSRFNFTSKANIKRVFQNFKQLVLAEAELGKGKKESTPV